MHTVANRNREGMCLDPARGSVTRLPHQRWTAMQSTPVQPVNRSRNKTDLSGSGTRGEVGWKRGSSEPRGTRSPAVQNIIALIVTLGNSTQLPLLSADKLPAASVRWRTSVGSSATSLSLRKTALSYMYCRKYSSTLDTSRNSKYAADRGPAVSAAGLQSCRGSSASIAGPGPRASHHAPIRCINLLVN